MSEFEMGRTTGRIETEQRLVPMLDECRELLDGAYEVVELWSASSPSQQEWRTKWLAGARKFGAGSDDASGQNHDWSSCEDPECGECALLVKVQAAARPPDIRNPPPSGVGRFKEFISL